MKNILLKQIVGTAFYPLIFLAVIWLVYFIGFYFDLHLGFFGVKPRDFSGILGIITSVFVHGDLEHIASNSFPILVLGMLLIYFYRKIAIPAFTWIWLISGLWLWIGGRGNTFHIGASTLIYGLATFLFFSGVFRRHIQLMVVSALVVFLYGSIMWGVLPLMPEMSWEGHLFGAVAGILVAFNYRKEGPQRRVYEWENESDDDESENDLDDPEIPGENTDTADGSRDIRINYIYKKDPFKKG